MDSSKSGINTSVCSVTGINDLGFWVLVKDNEYFIPFSDYPGFRNASVNNILKITLHPPSQLHWEEIDIDIELNALTHPESFPLIYT
jgi:hypothetical protein